MKTKASSEYIFPSHSTNTMLNNPFINQGYKGNTPHRQMQKQEVPSPQTAKVSSVPATLPPSTITSSACHTGTKDKYAQYRKAGGLENMLVEPP